MNHLEETFQNFVDVIALTQVKAFKSLNLTKNQKFLDFTAKITKDQHCKLKSIETI